MMTDSALRTPSGSLREDDMLPVHQETLRRMLSLFGELPSDRVRLELVREQAGCRKMIATSSNPSASVIEVLFYGEHDPQDVAVAVGEDAFLSLPTDIYGKHAQNWREFLDDFVRGVIEGTLAETLEYRGKRLVRSTFTVRLGERPFTFTRTNVPNYLRGLFKKRRERTASYAPFL